MLGLLIAQEPLMAQKKLSEGKILYSLSLDIPEGMDNGAMIAAMMPTELSVTFKGSKVRSEFATGMSETIILNDAQVPNNSTILMDMMGNKYAMKVDEKKILEQKANMPKYDIMVTKESKDIAGYKCVKAVLINQSNKDEVIVYYSPEIPFMENSFNAEFKDVKGMPFEYTAKMNGMKMTLSVKEVSKEKVQESIFTIPAEFKLVTQEDLMKELGGAGE